MRESKRVIKRKRERWRKRERERESKVGNRSSIFSRNFWIFHKNTPPFKENSSLLLNKILMI